MKTTTNKLGWGRAKTSSAITSILTSLLFLSVPFLVIYFYAALRQFHGSLIEPIFYILSSSAPLSTAVSLIPAWSWPVFFALCAWVLFQAALYIVFPGPKADGQATPAGHVLHYNVNGWRTYCLSVTGFIAGGLIGIYDLSVVYDNWGALLLSAQVIGFALTIFASIKARLFPTHPDDVKFTGVFLYDVFMGSELNPRIGDLDLKLFCNGRPGITAWTIINISYAAAQYNLHGYVTVSMVLVNFLEFLYVADFFWNEAWYLKTIDIAHDHYGFMLAWGDMVWLPFMYTLQGHYLVEHAVELKPIATIGILLLGFGGYFLFRAVNAQKDEFRASNGAMNIWGKPAQFMEVSYVTADGKTRQTRLLTSGWWGLARHFNYVGDLMLSLAYCLPCGFGHVLPYFYIIYMTILLVHRSYRDGSRLKAKYGDKWNEYCKKVKWQICPYIF